MTGPVPSRDITPSPVKSEGGDHSLAESTPECACKLIHLLNQVDAKLGEITQPEYEFDAGAAVAQASLLSKRTQILRGIASAPAWQAGDFVPMLDVMIDVLIEMVGPNGQPSALDADDANFILAGLKRVRESVSRPCFGKDKLLSLEDSSRVAIEQNSIAARQFFARPRPSGPDLIMHQIAIPKGETTEDRRGSVLVGVSEGWCQLLGYRPEQVIGTNILDRVTDESRAVAFKLYPRLLEDGYFLDERLDFVAKCGEVVRVTSSGVVLRDSEGRITNGVSIYEPYD